jgi:hypothetical protein
MTDPVNNIDQIETEAAVHIAQAYNTSKMLARLAAVVFLILLCKIVVTVIAGFSWTAVIEVVMIACIFALIWMLSAAYRAMAEVMIVSINTIKSLVQPIHFFGRHHQQ